MRYPNFPFIIFFACALSLGFSLKAQMAKDSVWVDGHYRTFHFQVPLNKEGGRSLVFVLHGSGGSSLQIRKGAMKLEALSEKEKILVVYPDGYKHFWNECRKAAATPPNVENIDEQAFFDGMIRYFNQRYGIDLQRVYAMGTSGGGHLVYKLALTMPEKFKAVAAFIANLPSPGNMDCVESKVPVSVMMVNGTDDPLNPYQGGEMRTSTVYFGHVRSTDETFQYWARLAGHSGLPKKTVLPDVDPNDGKTIEQYGFRKKGKQEVVLLKVIGGKHDYPNDIDVHVYAWDFFKRQR